MTRSSWTWKWLWRPTGSRSAEWHPDTTELSTWCDGELAHAPAREVRSHLAECATCAAAVEGLRDVRRGLRALRELERPVPPDELQFRLRIALAAERADARRAPLPWWRRTRWLFYPSAVAGATSWVLVVAVVLLHSVPVRGFDDGGQARKQSEEWRRLDRYEALLDFDSVQRNRSIERTVKPLPSTSTASPTRLPSRLFARSDS